MKAKSRRIGLILIYLYVLVLFGCQQKSKNLETLQINTSDLKRTAEYYYSINDYPAALIYLNELISRDSTNGEYFYKRGYCYAQLNNLDQSTLSYLKSVDLGYRESDAYYNIAINHIPTLNDSIVLFYLEKSLSLDSNSIETKKTIEAWKDRLRKKPSFSI